MSEPTKNWRIVFSRKRLERMTADELVAVAAAFFSLACKRLAGSSPEESRNG